jgi:ankyrin repeat protein
MDTSASIPDGGTLQIPKDKESSIPDIDLLIENTINGNYDVAKSLLLKGIKPTSTTTKNVNSSFHCALMGETNEHTDFLELLSSSYKCSPNEELGRYPNITIPLILVVSLPEVHIQIILNRVNLLLDKGADVNGADNNGKNALHHAISRIGVNLEGVVALIHLLLKRGASVTTILSPLKVALKLMQNTTVSEELSTYESIIKLLVSYGCQLTKITRNDISCLSNQTRDFIKSSAHRQMMHYPLLQGNMKKLSPFFSFFDKIKLYQDRYYVIQNDGSLYYYKSKYNFETGGLPKGCIEKVNILFNIINFI